MPEALEAARAISNDDAKARALTGLAEHLPPELMPDALEALSPLPRKFALDILFRLVKGTQGEARSIAAGATAYVISEVTQIWP